MRQKGKFLVFLLLLILASGVFLISQLTIVDESLLKSDWEIYQEKVMEENSFIEKIDIYGTSPALCFRFTLNEEVSDAEIERIFLETRAYLFQENVFSDMVGYHNERYTGTLDEVCIVFTLYNVNNDNYPTFFSPNNSIGEPNINSFKEWYVDADDTTIKYVEKE
jgi:hypothetical protein